MRFLALITLFFSIMSAPIAAQEAEVRASRGDVIRLLGQIPEFSDTRQEFRDLGYEGEKLELAVRQSDLLYRDPVLVEYLADRLIEAFLDPKSVESTDGILMPLIRRGLGHLPTTELRFYYQIEQFILSSLPQRSCGRAVRDRLSANQFSELVARTAVRLSTDTLREYYRIQAKAARFGVTREPVLQSRAKRVEIEDRVNGRLAEKIAQSGNSRSLLSAVGNLERAGNAQACQVGRMFMETVMEFRGPELRETLVYMSQP